MALILYGEKRIRVAKIRPENKRYTLKQTLKPSSLAVMQAARQRRV